MTYTQSQYDDLKRRCAQDVAIANQERDLAVASSKSRLWHGIRDIFSNILVLDFDIQSLEVRERMRVKRMLQIYKELERQGYTQQ